MEKYYDLIVSLIKNNRKFVDYESILDDIVKDVWSHAEVIVSSVDNETIIRSYLEKIVATSLITVPRQLGLRKTRQSSYKLPTSSERNNLEKKEPVSVKTEEIKETAPESEVVAEEEIIIEKQPVDKELVDMLINNISKEDEVSDNAAIESSDSVETQDDDITEDEEPIFSENLTEDESKDGVEEDVEESIDLTEEFSVIDSEEEIEDLVDDEIKSEELDSLADENDSGSEVVSAADEISEPIDESVEEETPIIEVSEQDSSTYEAAESLEGIKELAVEDDSEDKLILFEDEFEEDTATDNTEPVLQESNDPVSVENFEEEPTSSLLDEDFSTVEELPELTQDETEESSFTIVEDYVDENEDEKPFPSMDFEGLNVGSELIPETINIISNSNSSFRLPTYGQFDYEPNFDFEGSAIIDVLKSIDQKYPDKQIFKICNLKFKENQSIEVIAKSLNQSEDDITEILDIIVNTVKD